MDGEGLLWHRRNHLWLRWPKQQHGKSKRRTGLDCSKQDMLIHEWADLSLEIIFFYLIRAHVLRRISQSNVQHTAGLRGNFNFSLGCGTLRAESPSIFLEKETLLTACTIPIEHAPNSNVTEPRAASLSELVNHQILKFDTEIKQIPWLWFREAWNRSDFNFCDSTFHGFFKDYVWKRSSRHVCRSIVNNMPWARKSQQFLRLSMRTRDKPVWPVRNWTDSSIFWMIGGSKNVQAVSRVSFLFPIFLGRSKETLLAG